MGNRFENANPGNCLARDELVVKAEQDPEGNNNIGRFIYNQWGWYCLPSLLIECNVVDVVYVIVVDDVDVFVDVVDVVYIQSVMMVLITIITDWM